MDDKKQMPDEIWAGETENETAYWCVPTVKNLTRETKYIRADRYVQNLFTETKALRDHIDGLDAEIADLVSQPASVGDEVCEGRNKCGGCYPAICLDRDARGLPQPPPLVTPDAAQSALNSLFKMREKLGALQQTASYGDLGLWVSNHLDLVSALLQQAAQIPAPLCPKCKGTGEIVNKDPFDERNYLCSCQDKGDGGGGKS